MKLITTLAVLLYCSTSFSQWTRVQQLPPSNMFTLFHKDSVLYAGGINVVYISKNKGQTWDSTAAIPQLPPVISMINNIIVYKNEIYASASSRGVFKSLDGGASWQPVNAGIPQLIGVTDFCEYRGDLYAATEGGFINSIYKLNPGRTNWLTFSNGLTSISSNLNSIMGNSSALIAATNVNGLYDHLAGNSSTWEERFLTSPVSVSEGTFDIVTGHDTLFLAGRTGLFYMSTDNGLSWSIFGNRLVSGATFIANAKQALITSRYIFDGVSSNTRFYYIKKDSLQHPFRNFDFVTNHFSWKIDILDGKLWDASDRGLFYMPLSHLPGITDAGDTLPGTLPVHFISVNASCEQNKVLIKWKTAQEQNSKHYNVERSTDGISWTVIANLPAAGNSTFEKTYSFTDNSPVQNAFYRIGEHDLDGKVQYSNTIRSACTAAGAFKFWPNPVKDILYISIIAGKASKATVKIFDAGGAVVKTQGSDFLQGNNQLGVDMRSLPKGTYRVLLVWDNGQTKRSVSVIKQ